MKVFHHHIYEYTKGIRKLILHTTRRENQHTVARALRSKEIAHLIFPVGDHKINVFSEMLHVSRLLKNSTNSI